MFQFPTFPTWSYVFTSCFTVLHRECFHIRKSADRSLFAAPRSLSQLVTSFFGSWCQGIHLMLLFAWTSSGSFLPVRSFELVLLNCLSFFLNKCFGFLRSKKVWSFLRFFRPAQWSLIKLSEIVVLLPKFGKTYSNLFIKMCPLLSVRFYSIILYSVFNEHFLPRKFPSLKAGGLKWTRTTDLALIRRAL